MAAINYTNQPAAVERLCSTARHSATKVTRCTSHANSAVRYVGTTKTRMNTMRNTPAPTATNTPVSVRYELRGTQNMFATFAIIFVARKPTLCCVFIYAADINTRRRPAASQSVVVVVVHGVTVWVSFCFLFSQGAGSWLASWHHKTQSVYAHISHTHSGLDRRDTHANFIWAWSLASMTNNNPYKLICRCRARFADVAKNRAHDDCSERDALPAVAKCKLMSSAS